MNTQQIADRLVQLCRQADYETAQLELYADNAVSIEPMATPDFEKETKGLDNILEKGRKFTALTKKIHSTTVSDPLVVNNSIAFILTMDITMVSERHSNMSELCVYEIKDGKIVSEQFYM